MDQKQKNKLTAMFIGCAVGAAIVLFRMFQKGVQPQVILTTFVIAAVFLGLCWFVVLKRAK